MSSYYPQFITDAEYVLVSLDGRLVNARVLTAGTNITITDAGAQSTITIESTGGGAPGTPGGWQFNDADNSSHALLTCMD